MNKKLGAAVLLLCSARMNGVDYTFQNIIDTSPTSPIRGLKAGVVINDAGTVAFVGVNEFDGRNASKLTLYTSSNGQLKTIVDTTGNLADLSLGGLNNSGTVSFLAMDRNFSYGIFTGDGGPVNTIALNSSTLSVGPYYLPDISDDGAVVHTTNSRIFVRRGADLQTVMDLRTGPRAGAAPVSAQWNSRGDLSFLLVDSHLSNGGVFYLRSGTVNTLTDDTGTVLTVGGNYNGLASMNESGVAAFTGWTKALPIQQGVFTVAPGGRVTTVHAGPLAGDPVGGGMVAINNQGVVVYSLSRSGNQVATILTGPDLAKDKVIRVGDPLFGSKVAGLSTVNYAAGRFLNQRGQIAFSYQLENGLLGFAVATPVNAGSGDGKPVLPAGSIVNAASLAPQAPPSPGTVISVFGANFATRLTVADTPTLPTSLDGVSLLFNGVPAPLFFVSPTQINAQVPFSLTGTSVEVRVRNAGGESETRPLPLTTLDPAIYTMDQSGKGQGVVVLANSAIIAANAGAYPGSRPVRRGETVTIYANGLGAVAPSIASGVNSCGGVCAADGSNLVLRGVITTPTLVLNGIAVPAANVLFAGLTPQFPGLYQVNVTIPADAPTGTVKLRLLQGTNIFSREDVTIEIQ